MSPSGQMPIAMAPGQQPIAMYPMAPGQVQTVIGPDGQPQQMMMMMVPV